MALILYVEDHPPARLLMQAIISDMTDHKLVLASSGADAQHTLATQQPDLYIIDLDLPDTDGLTLAGDLKALHSAPVLLVSAYAEAVKDAPLHDAIDIYLAKPLDPEHVVETIKRALA